MSCLTPIDLGSDINWKDRGVRYRGPCGNRYLQKDIYVVAVFDPDVGR